MTEAENLISEGLRAIMYTKGESKKGKGTHTTEKSIMEATRESEHHAVLRPFGGLEFGVMPQESRQGTQIPIAFSCTQI